MSHRIIYSIRNSLTEILHNIMVKKKRSYVDEEPESSPFGERGDFGTTTVPLAPWEGSLNIYQSKIQTKSFRF